MRFVVERESTHVGTISVVDVECFLDMEKEKNVIIVFLQSGYLFFIFFPEPFSSTF